MSSYSRYGNWFSVFLTPVFKSVEFRPDLIAWKLLKIKFRPFVIVNISCSQIATMSENRHRYYRVRMELGDVTHHNIKQLKRVNQVIFPVSYNDRFYKDVVAGGELAKLAYFNDIVVGGVCCRVDASEGRRRLYIMTLGCLAPYRRYGLGSLMLNHVLSLCSKDHSIESVYLHVQISNDDALAFYKRSGFVIKETTQNYYKRIEPADAFVLERVVDNSVAASTQTSDLVPASA